MPTLPVFRFSNLQPVVRLLREAGAPVERMLRGAHLPCLGLEDHAVFVPTHLGLAFCERAARQEGIGDLGWQSGIQLDMASLSFARAALALAFDLRDGIRRLGESLRAESPLLQLQLQEQGDEASLAYRPSVPYAYEGGAFDEQYMLAALTEFLGAAVGPQFHPRRVSVRCLDPRAFEHAPTLQTVPIQVGQSRLEIFFGRSLLDRPVAHRCRETTCTGLPPPPEPWDFTATLHHVVASHLSDGLPRVDAAAEMAGMSVRTLQRSLSQSALTYRDLCDRIRRDVALELILDPLLTVEDLAEETGYGDPANFTRAFRRWTGTSPRTYRKTHLR